jgi:hypothetical protein
MIKKLDCRALLASFCLIVAPISLLAQKSSPPFPRDGAQKVQDNDRVIAWDVTYEKGKSTGMRKLNLDQVVVTLSDGAVKITRPDGTWSIEEERMGNVRYEPKGTTLEQEGVSDKPCHAVVFQLQEYKPEPWPTIPGVPAQFPRINTTKLFETDRIIVWDQVWKLGDKVSRHAHYHRTAAVFLQGGTIHSIPDSGVPNPPFTRKPGDVISTVKWNPDVHEEESISGAPRAIWIEFIK